MRESAARVSAWPVSRALVSFGLFVLLMVLAVAAWASAYNFEAHWPSTDFTSERRWTMFRTSLQIPAGMLVSPRTDIIDRAIVGLPVVLLVCGILWRHRPAARFLGYCGVFLWFALGMMLSLYLY